jgi:hypothetical protein
MYHFISGPHFENEVIPGTRLSAGYDCIRKNVLPFDCLLETVFGEPIPCTGIFPTTKQASGPS